MALRCVNCGIALKNNGKHRPSESEELKFLIQCWINQTLSAEDSICTSCNKVALTALETGDHTRCYGHNCVCFICGKSLQRGPRRRKQNFRSFKLFIDGKPNAKYYSLFSELIAPEQISESSIVCHACLSKAKRYSIKRELLNSSFYEQTYESSDEKYDYEQPKLSINALCRVCLLENEKDNMLWIFDDECKIQEKIQFCTGLRITNDNNKPSMICTTCNSDLNSAYIFKTNYIKSDERLAKFLDKKPIKRKETLSSDNKDESQVKRIKKEFEVELNFDDVPVPFVYNEEGSTRSIENADKDVEEEGVVNGHGETSEHDILDNDFDVNSDEYLSKYFAYEYQIEEPEPTSEIVLHTCYVCTKEFTNVEELKIHRRTHSKRQFKCEICGLHGIGCKKTHMDTHPIKKFECDDCGRTYNTKKSLYKHIKKYYLNEVKPQKPHVKTKKVVKQRECEICRSKFDSRQELSTHMKEHNSDHWICPICGVQGAGHISSHMLTHSTKKFECDDCGKIFKAKQHVYHHIRKYHLKLIATFQCEICSKILTSNFGLQLHNRRVHLKERNYKCLECGAMKFNQAQLKQHMFKHNGIKEKKCDLCDSAFARITYLKYHLLKDHGVKVPNCNTKITRIERATDFIRSYLISIGRLKSSS